MRTKLFLGCFVLILSFFSASAATNDLTSTLQRGLFEEEANRNLDAAAQAYQAVSLQFDKDRALAATAIFRLGEIYRKQNKTNEAAAQYERIVREFIDQDTLVTLSRQNLAGLTPNRVGTNTVAQTTPALSATDAELFQRLKSLSRDQLWQVFPSFLPDPVLTELQKELNATDTKLLEARQNYSDQHPEVQRLTAMRTLLTKKIDERLSAAITALEIRANLANATAVSTKTDDEEAEIRRIQVMIKDSPDLINAKEAAGGTTPLHSAASKGQLTVAQFLLANGADIEARDRQWDGRTPLQYAAWAGRKAMVELLLSKKADVNSADNTGNTALHLAVLNGFRSVVEVLVAGGANVNAQRKTGVTPLHLAVVNGYQNMAETLLKFKANPDVNTSEWLAAVGSGESFSGTPLHIAIARRDRPMVELLLANKANINTPDNNGNTPLHVAVRNDSAELVGLLLAKGASVNLTNQQGTAPLLMAMQQPQIAKLLLDQKANPDTSGMFTRREPNGTMISSGSYPLRAAVQLKNLELLTLLLERGANPNTDGKYRTDTLGPPLWFAVSTENEDAVKVLLQFKANPNSVDSDDLTPLMRAAGNGNRGIVELLLTSGADAKAANKRGWTALHSAAGRRNPEIVQLLLTSGADPNVRNSDGQTPLDLAKQAPGPVAASPGVVMPSPGSRPIPTRALRQPVGSPPEGQPTDVAPLLRQHGALDELPDFNSIRITRQGLVRPQGVFSIGPKLTNQFTLLETVMRFYNERTVLGNGGFPVAAFQALPFPDFGRFIIHRPSRSSGGKEQEIKVSLLNSSNVVDCTKDVPVQPGDVIEIPERVHALNEVLTDPVREMEAIFSNAKSKSDTARNYQKMIGNETHAPVVRALKEEAEAKVIAESWACLRKAIQLVVGGKTNSLLVDSWKEGFLSQALRKLEAQAVLRSSSDLSRVKVTRQDAKTGKPVVLVVDLSGHSKHYDDLWLCDGDVVEVLDKP